MRETDFSPPKSKRGSTFAGSVRALGALCIFLSTFASACAGSDDDSDEASDDITAAKVNGGSTGAFLRQVTTPGFTRIQSTVTLPDYRTRDNPTPWIYYGMDDGTVDVEVGFAFQQGTVDQTLPRRYLAYIRRGKQFLFAQESDRVLPGATVKIAAEYSGGKVYAEQDGQRLTMRAHDGAEFDGLTVSLDKTKLQLRRVVGLARAKNDYTGQVLPKLGPTVFVDTKVRATSGELVSFEGDRANWARKSASGVRYGTIAWPASAVHRETSGTRETISLF